MSDGAIPDSELVRRCRGGDEKAFETLFHRYRLQLYSYLNQLLPKQTAVVDDVYQQSWIKVLENLATYQEKQKFMSWLFRIAHNLAVDHFRRTGKLAFTELDDRLPAPESEPWHALDRAELKSRLEGAIAALPEFQREVVLLRQQGISFREIAQIQDASINTVLGRMHYAVRRLQMELPEWTQDR